MSEETAVNCPWMGSFGLLPVMPRHQIGIVSSDAHIKSSFMFKATVVCPYYI